MVAHVCTSSDLGSTTVSRAYKKPRRQQKVSGENTGNPECATSVGEFTPTWGEKCSKALRSGGGSTLRGDRWQAHCAELLSPISWPLPLFFRFFVPFFPFLCAMFSPRLVSPFPPVMFQVPRFFLAVPVRFSCAHSLNFVWMPEYATYVSTHQSYENTRNTARDLGVSPRSSDNAPLRSIRSLAHTWL